jgi:hypothetical protein
MRQQSMCSLVASGSFWCTMSRSWSTVDVQQISLCWDCSVPLPRIAKPLGKKQPSWPPVTNHNARLKLCNAFFHGFIMCDKHQSLQTPAWILQHQKTSLLFPLPSTTAHHWERLKKKRREKRIWGWGDSGKALSRWSGKPSGGPEDPMTI